MKNSEIITKYAGRICDSMVEHYRVVLESHGLLAYKIYVWEDGEVECLETTPGSSDRLVSRDPSRSLVYVTTVSAPCFDPWDCTIESKPEDDAERANAEVEIIDWCMDEYCSNLYDTIGAIIMEKEIDEALNDQEMP